MAQYFRIATKDFCNTLLPGAFTGDTTMCPTRSQIEAAGLHIKKGYIYSADQLVPEDHIERLDWEYTFSVTPATATISAAGGSQKFTVTSYKRQYSYSTAGNRIYVEGAQTDVGYTSSNNQTAGSGTWTAANDTISYGANTGSTQPSGTITWTQSESFGSDPKKTAAATHKQNADSIKPNGDGYSNPRITAFSYPTVIPAAGGNSTPSYSYEQTVYWVSGKTTALTSGGTPLFNRTSGTATVNSSSGLADTGSKGTTASSQTTVAVVSLTVTMNGKSSSASSANVSQAANSYSDGSYGSWGTPSISANPTTIAGAGGISTISYTSSISRSYVRIWSSGSTQNLSQTSDGSISIYSNPGGFSLSGSALTASANNSNSSRTCTVRGTWIPAGITKDVSVSQGANTQTKTETKWKYTFSSTPVSLDFPADGGTKTVSVASYKQSATRTCTSNDGCITWACGTWSDWGSQVSVGYSGTVSGTGFSGSGNTVTAGANNSTSSRNGTLVLTQTRSGGETTDSGSSPAGIDISLNQAGKDYTFTYKITNNNKDGCSFMYNHFAGNYEIKPFSTENFRNAPLGEGAIVISRGDVIFDFSESQNILSITDEKTAANELFNVHISNKRLTSSIVNLAGSASTYTVRITLHMSDGAILYRDIIHYS